MDTSSIAPRVIRRAIFRRDAFRVAWVWESKSRLDLQEALQMAVGSQRRLLFETPL
jgi:hypothetical protein